MHALYSARFGARALVLWSASCACVMAVGCGIQGHPQPVEGISGSGGAVTGTGNTGPAPGTGGQAPGSGGQSLGSGGQMTGIGTGGQSSGAGGQGTTGTGGQTTGTGTGGQQGGTGGAGNVVGAATGGASGLGITINGTFVPKEKAIVFVHFGHSNMKGMAMNPASLHPFFYDTQPGLWSYQSGTTFTLAKEPTAPEGTSTTAGPGTALLKIAAAAANPSGGYQFISIGRGVSSDTTADYQKTIGGAPGALYASFITNRAMMLKGKVTFGAIFVMLGITERHLPAAQQPGYPMRVKQLIADIRADLQAPGEADIPVLYCDYEQNALGDLAPTGAVGMVILPLTRMLPTFIPSNFVLVPTDNILRADYEDDHHFTMTGHQLWATSAIGLMKTKGWFLWQ